jgi:hypothetical protein
MGELVSMAFGHDADHNDTCGDCGMDTTESSCCKDESLLLKVYDGHHPSSVSFNSYKFISDPNLFFSVYNYDFPLSGIKFSSVDYDSFSSWQTNKRYVQFCVFRI